MFKRSKKIIFAAFSALISTTLCATGDIPVSAGNQLDNNELNVISFYSHGASPTGENDLVSVDSDGNEVNWNLIPQHKDKAGLYSSIPEKYDLRDKGFSTAVRNQKQTGTCWAHACLASAESSMIIKGLTDENIDLSEAHMVWFMKGQAPYNDVNDPLFGDGENFGTDAYSDPNYSGGNAVDAQAALARGSGVQLEENEPHVYEEPVIDESHRYISYGTLLNSDMIDPLNDPLSVKEHLMSVGAMKVSYFSSVDDAYIGSSNGTAFYQDIYSNASDHAVTIIGWDDNYSRENFGIAKPEKDGAWICKNSWGENWGDNGYFYISYCEPSLKDATSFEMAAPDTFDDIYQYDGSRQMTIAYSREGYTSKPITGANVFTAKSDDQLSAIGFYTTEADVPYKIYIYSGCTSYSPNSGKLLYTNENNNDVMPYAGYHIVELEEKVRLTKGEKFSIIITLNKSGTGMGVDHRAAQIDGATSLYASGALSRFTMWSDLTQTHDANITIKGYVSADREINEETFPDPAFREYISENIDADNNGKLSNSEIADTTVLNVENMGIYSLEGIGKLTALQELYCGGNPIIQLDLRLNSKLNVLDCQNCGRNFESVDCGEFCLEGVNTQNITAVSGGAYLLDNTIMIMNGSNSFSYTYDCGRGFYGDFSITYDLLNHSYSEWLPEDWGHTRKCSCGSYIQGEHNFIIECSDDQESHYMICSECKYITAKESHTSNGEWHNMGEYDVSECEICGSAMELEHGGKFWAYDSETHRGYCSNCGEYFQEEVVFTPGDVNMDGSVDSIDAACLRTNIIYGYSNIMNKYSSDINGDSEVNSADLVMLTLYLLEKINI